MKKSTKSIVQKQAGFALPLVFIFLLIFTVIGVALVSRFSGTGSKELIQTKSMNKKYSNAYAGIERARYELLRPDNTSYAHAWALNSLSTYSFTLNGDRINISVEDLLWAE